MFSGFDINVTTTSTYVADRLLAFPTLAVQVNHEVRVTKLQYFITWQKTGRPHQVIRWDRSRGLVEEWKDGQWIDANNETNLRQIFGYDTLMKPVAAPESREDLLELISKGRDARYLHRSTS